MLTVSKLYLLQNPVKETDNPTRQNLLWLVFRNVLLNLPCSAIALC